MTEFFFPFFSHYTSLCPVQALHTLELHTSERRKEANGFSLFLTLVQPYNPVAPSTIARWLKSFLSKAGIDTIHLRHTQSEAPPLPSSAANTGIITTDILALEQ